MVKTRRWVRSAAVSLLALCAACGFASSAGAAAVDGVSDQSLPFWDAAPGTGWEGTLSLSPFAQYFHDVWASSGHIKYARYVMQWNAKGTNAYGAFESWYAEVTQDLKLTPVLAFYNFRRREEANPSEVQYTAAMTEVLKTHPGIAVVEAWNEPNDNGVSEAAAAHYANAAFGYCRSAGCTVLAGDFLDKPHSLEYATRYKQDLSPTYAPLMKDWALHPYFAVNRSGTEAQALRDSVMAGENLWITEIGAYYCYGHNAEPARETGERTQTADAERLVGSVIPSLRPVHVFYYEFLFKAFALTPCEAGESDTALYNPDDSARSAARLIFGSALPPLVRGESSALLAEANPGNPLTGSSPFGAQG